MKNKNYLLLLFAGIFFILLYMPVFSWMSSRFSAEDSYYSHGILVPFVSLFFAWRKKEQLKEASVKPNFLGAAIIIFSLLLHFFSTWFKIHFMSAFSMIFLISGIILFVWGTRVLRLLWFPIAFLVFMVPLPSVFLIYATFKLKMLAAYLASLLASSMGIIVEQAGSVIRLPKTTMVVDDTCSGLRSIISLLALGAVFAQLEPERAIPKRGIILASTVPIAIITNLVRIESLILLTYIYGAKVTMGFYHDLSGFLVFGLATVMLIGIGNALK